MPSAAAGAVTSTELQKSIFDHPPSSLLVNPTLPGGLKPPTNGEPTTDGKSPATSVAGQKRRRDDEDDEPEEDSDEDVAMEEDSDDD